MIHSLSSSVSPSSSHKVQRYDSFRSWSSEAPCPLLMTAIDSRFSPRTMSLIAFRMLAVVAGWCGRQYGEESDCSTGPRGVAQVRIDTGPDVGYWLLACGTDP